MHAITVSLRLHMHQSHQPKKEFHLWKPGTLVSATFTPVLLVVFTGTCSGEWLASQWQCSTTWIQVISINTNLDSSGTWAGRWNRTGRWNLQKREHLAGPVQPQRKNSFVRGYFPLVECIRRENKRAVAKCMTKTKSSGQNRKGKNRDTHRPPHTLPRECRPFFLGGFFFSFLRPESFFVFFLVF